MLSQLDISIEPPCSKLLEAKMVEPVLRPIWCARHRFPKPLYEKTLAPVRWVPGLCEVHAGRRTGSRSTKAGAHVVAALHSCIVPRQCILPFTQTTSRQNHRSADAPRGTAVESSPRQTSAPAQVCCDRLRPSKNRRLKSFQSTAQIVDRDIMPVSPFVVAKFSAPPENTNETALPCTAIAQVAQQAPA